MHNVRLRRGPEHSLVGRQEVEPATETAAPPGFSLKDCDDGPFCDPGKLASLVIPIVLLIFLCVGFALLNQVRLRTVRAEKQKIDDTCSVAEKDGLEYDLALPNVDPHQLKLRHLAGQPMLPPDTSLFQERTSVLSVDSFAFLNSYPTALQRFEADSVRSHSGSPSTASRSRSSTLSSKGSSFGSPPRRSTRIYDSPAGIRGWRSPSHSVASTFESNAESLMLETDSGYHRSYQAL